MAAFRLVSGNIVPNLDGIHEAYDLLERSPKRPGQPAYSFCINLSAETIAPFALAFCQQVEEPCFFLCELRASQDEEQALRKCESDPFHMRVYYRDSRSRGELLDLFKTYGAWFVEDGLSRFGFGSHNGDELYIGPYKIATLFTDDVARYEALLARFGIPREQNMKTVWQNFTRETPGECRLVTLDGRTVYDIVEAMQREGLYFAEMREDS